jgi:hypothetical protein
MAISKLPLIREHASGRFELWQNKAERWIRK